MKKLFSAVAAALFVPMSLFGADIKPEVAKVVTPSSYLRLESKGGVPDALQTAVVTYQKGDVTIDLIGAIHIGDRAYYKQLNRHMEQYDALLYELVAQKGQIPDRKQQSTMGLILKLTGVELDSQVDKIDYSRKNFVHADMSFDEMQKAMEKRGEDIVIVGLRVLAESMQQKNLAKKNLIKNPLEALEMAQIATELQNAKTGTDMKRAMAKMMVLQMTGKTIGGSPTLSNLLINDRNGKAMEVFQEQLKAGKKKMGLFYGAAHMVDFDKRLRDMGFEPKKTMWITAWDLSDD